MSQENPWSNRRFIEPSELDRFPNRRRYLSLEDEDVSLAEAEPMFYVIVDASRLRACVEEKDQHLFGISVIEFETEEARADYLRKTLW